MIKDPKIWLHLQMRFVEQINSEIVSQIHPRRKMVWNFYTIREGNTY